MTDQEEEDRIAEAMRNPDIITEALAKGVRKALREHKLAGNPVAAWKDGKVVWIPPEEIPDEI